MNELRKVRARTAFQRYRKGQDFLVERSQASLLAGMGLVELMEKEQNDQKIKLLVGWQNYPVGAQLIMPRNLAGKLIARNYARLVLAGRPKSAH